MFEIYNCRECFGYTYLHTSNKKMQSLLFAYCEGRSTLWNMFFGWRKSTNDNKMFFWIPSRKIDELLKIAENF